MLYIHFSHYKVQMQRTKSASMHIKISLCLSWNQFLSYMLHCWTLLQETEKSVMVKKKT